MVDKYLTVTPNGYLPSTEGATDFATSQAQSTLDAVSESRYVSQFQNQMPKLGRGISAKSMVRPKWDVTWKSFTFVLKVPGGQEVITLALNPEDFTQNEPPRLTVTQTKGGAVVTNFGEGFRQVSIRGVTGYWPRGVSELSGQSHFIQLRSMIRKYWKEHANEPDKYTMEFYNWADDEAWEIIPQTFSLTRSVSRPLLYQYNIGFMCSKNIRDKSKEKYDSVGKNLVDYPARAPLIRNRLQTQLTWLDNLLGKDKSLLAIVSDATKNWGSWISKGGEFYNTVNSTYKTVESVISEVKQLAREVDTFVKGTTAFITKPFELIRDLSVSIADVITAVSSVTDVPHELVRNFREMICAINAIPESWFKGFTNPSLFEGASNCGSTAGIPEAPVASYSNSFSATSTNTSIRSVSELFDDPQSVLTLKEEPLRVAGVYLVTDISRTGVNFLDSSFGNQVNLSSIPSEGVVVDYDAYPESESDLVKLEASVSRIIKLGDNLSRIALDVYGDASKWKQIAVFNDLEYPFIMDTPTYTSEVYATGNVRFYRTEGYTSDIIIPEDYYVYVPYQSIIGTSQIDFQVNSNNASAYDSTGAKVADGSWVLLTGQNYIDVPVTAVYYGDVGNVAPNMIVGPYNDSTWSSMSTTFQTKYNKLTGISKISNISATTGGKVWKVLGMGDIIQIPREESDNDSIVIGAKQDYTELFGIDIAINKYGEIDEAATSAKDLRLISGVQNLVQALRNRIATTRGFYVYHDEYGTNLPIYIGKKNDPHWSGLIKWDITSAVLLDVRIEELKALTMYITGDTVALDFDAIPINEKTSIPFNVIV